MLGIQHKKSGAVLQYKTHPAHGHAGAEKIVNALDERRNVAVSVDHGQVRRIAFWRCAARRGAVGLLRINQSSTLVSVLFRKETSHRNRSKTGIAVVAIEIGVSELHRLNLLVQL